MYAVKALVDDGAEVALKRVYGPTSEDWVVLTHREILKSPAKMPARLFGHLTPGSNGGFANEPNAY